MPPAARPVIAVYLSSVATAPYWAGSTNARMGAGMVARTTATGTATAAYIRTARAAIIPPVARRDSDGKNAVATAAATYSGTRASAALAW